MARTRILVMDVDGTLTDGKIYIGESGELAKAFSVKDGAGISLVLPKYEIIPALITARKSLILENRCNELNINELHQNCYNKAEKLLELSNKYSVGLESIAYIGDDLPDIPSMELVKKAGGLVLCPADAIAEIKALSNYVSGCKSGDGAIRDCINYLIQMRESTAEEKVKQTMDWILNKGYLSNNSLEGVVCILQEYVTKPEADCQLESHRRHIDIQYIIEGIEEFKIYSSNCLTSIGVYNDQEDIELWNDGIVSSHIVLQPGSMVTVKNNIPHMGAIQHIKQAHVKKLVCKIEV